MKSVPVVKFESEHSKVSYGIFLASDTYKVNVYNHRDRLHDALVACNLMNILSEKKYVVSICSLSLKERYPYF